MVFFSNMCSIRALKASALVISSCLAALTDASSTLKNGTSTNSIKEVMKQNDLRRRTTQKECLICDKLGTEFLPLEVPSSTTYASTCEELQNNEVRNYEGNSSVCEAYQNLHESSCCDTKPFSISTMDCIQNVRSHILDGYDTFTPPSPGVNGQKDSIEVTFLFTYIGVKKLDVKSSTLELFMSIRLSWKDPRLSWNNVDNRTFCVDSVDVRADPSLEETEIWVPPIDLLNKATSLHDLPSAPALVKHDGTVVWSRDGSLTAICSFTGLKKMPFDDIGCGLFFGNVAGDLYSSHYVLSYMGENNPSGLLFFGNVINYAEFKVIREKSRTGYYEPLRNSPVIMLSFHRAQRHYVYFTLIPSILFCLLSFGQFRLDPKGSERLSYSITILLITITQSIVTAHMLPVCSESLWLNTFTFVSMIFTITCVLETIIVIWILEIEKIIAEKELSRSKGINKTSMDGVEEQEGASLAESKNNEEFFSLVSHEDGKFNIESDINEEEVQNVVKKERIESGNEDKETINVSDHEDVGRWRNTRLVKIFTTKLEGLEDLRTRLDFIFLIMMPLIYVCFAISMFARNKHWDDDAYSNFSEQLIR